MVTFWVDAHAAGCSCHWFSYLRKKVNKMPCLKKRKKTALAVCASFKCFPGIIGWLTQNMTFSCGQWTKSFGLSKKLYTFLKKTIYMCVCVHVCRERERFLPLILAVSVCSILCCTCSELSRMECFFWLFPFSLLLK